METANSTEGLNCPNCGGKVPIPEGEIIVRCPYCDLRSLVRGERGLLRYQIPLEVDQTQAGKKLNDFLTSTWQIANRARRIADLQEIFLTYLPFWANWSQVVGWVLGEEKVGSGKHAHYEPREVKLAEPMTWNKVACDVGEFGVETIPLSNQELMPFDADQLHASGMVFEPVGSISDARGESEDEFKQRVEDKANLDRVSQVFTRYLNQRMGLVYYPLWIIRYLYRGRAFQIVVDGSTGKVLYGKAPGDTIFRSMTLVFGMAAGALLSIDLACGALWISSKFNDSDWLFGVGIGLVLLGIAVMRTAYRRYRFGEIYEYRAHKISKRKRSTNLLERLTKEIEGLG
jgi:hypothetical protein